MSEIQSAFRDLSLKDASIEVLSYCLGRDLQFCLNKN